MLASLLLLAVVEATWHAPSKTQVNDLASAINGTGTYGFIFNSSATPDDRYGAYNYCNMPHVRRREYVKPLGEYELVYVELMHRHHKRTPYASNGFPREQYRWDCDDERLFMYAQPDDGHDAAAVFRQGFEAHLNPFARGWRGSCQFPQITAGGLRDSWQHGADLYGVYHDLLGLMPAGGSKAVFRVTNNPITSQVAAMVVGAMGQTDAVPLWTQAAGVDSLEPQYPCPEASALFSGIKSRANAEWARHLDAAGDIFARLDGISGVAPDDGSFHASFDPYFDNLSARQCHDKPLPCKLSRGSNDCVTQDLADAVYRLGNWEYSQIYRGHPDSLVASAASLGVWISELTGHLRRAVAGTGDVVYLHNIAHDGSVARLLSVLQIDQMVWPGTGAEVVFELYKRRTREIPALVASNHHRRRASTDGDYRVRVLFGGRVLTSSVPALGRMDMLPLETLLGYLDDLVGVAGESVVKMCRSK